MEDEEHPQSSRKRPADKQINKNNPELDDCSPEQDAGTFRTASEEVMAMRRTVKVPCQQPPSAPSSNPFSAIRFSPGDSCVQESIPVSYSPPSDVTSNVNGSGSSKSGNTDLGTAEDKVLVGEPKEDNGKTSRNECKTEDMVAEVKKFLAMDDDGKSDHIMCVLADRHIQSVVCLKVRWKVCSTEGRRPIPSLGTGSIIHWSKEFILILSCSTTFTTFITCAGPAFDSTEILNENIILEVEFCDGHSAKGEVWDISWWKDLCLVLIPFPENFYEPVKFIDDENLGGQSIYKRGTAVFSIFCFPTDLENKCIFFGSTSTGKICGRPILGNDLHPVYDPDLEFFELTMRGGGICPGRPVFTDGLLVMGICICRFDMLEFALTLGQIQRWLHNCFDIKTKSMNETVAILARIISGLRTTRAPTPHSPRNGIHPARHQDHLCPSQLTAQACPDAPLLPEAPELVPKCLTMDYGGKSAGIMCELAHRHLQSVVCLKVQWNYITKKGRKPIIAYGSGSIVHSSKKLIVILSSANALRPFTTHPGPDFSSVEMLNENTILQVDFYDGHSAIGGVYCIDWRKNLCLVLVADPVNSYVPIKFIDDRNLMGQSYKRGTEVFSIFCLPTYQKDNQLLFGTITNGKICGGSVIGNDLDPVYALDLKFFEFDMPGSLGSYGAPVFNEKLLVLGIWVCPFEQLEFALKIDQIRLWLHDHFELKQTRSMNGTIARVCAFIRKRL